MTRAQTRTSTATVAMMAIRAPSSGAPALDAPAALPLCWPEQSDPTRGVEPHHTDATSPTAANSSLHVLSGLSSKEAPGSGPCRWEPWKL
mmetsp:Transcript_2009/g.5464  ORF Transcript_2009/g.5464 Transcript_2009/m.5464 type:complete len:90 (+) Transcript_2009:1-270(+)